MLADMESSTLPVREAAKLLSCMMLASLVLKAESNGEPFDPKSKQVAHTLTFVQKRLYIILADPPTPLQAKLADSSTPGSSSASKPTPKPASSADRKLKKL